jgi:hypothetical protein
MAELNVAIDVRIEWLEAREVSTPELAATWARYEVWIGDRCATQVESSDGTFRRSVYGSLYPLAEWIAANWWLLSFHVRPSAIDARYWTWSNARTHRWLSAHNVRGAGDGMAWPDMTVVPEGSMTRLHWAADQASVYRDLRFVSGGYAWARSTDVRRSLAAIVEHVLDRLAEQDLPKTRLAEEWMAIAESDDELDFCRAAARLGLDPYAVDEILAEEIVRVAAALPEDLVEKFFESAQPSALTAAAAWSERSLAAARRATRKARLPLGELQDAIGKAGGTADAERPWTLGYAMARTVRGSLGVSDTQLFDITPWVGRATVSTSSAGIQGAVAVELNRCGVVLGSESFNPVFGSAKALGKALLRPGMQHFLLSAARTDDERTAGAFAAELLAPADGIREMLAVLGKEDDFALEAVAKRYRVSPLLVRHQYDNQLASARG